MQASFSEQSASEFKVKLQRGSRLHPLYHSQTEGHQQTLTSTQEGLVDRFKGIHHRPPQLRTSSKRLCTTQFGS